jgi:hypothetical protein
MAELDPGIRDLLQAVYEVLGAPLPDIGSEQPAYIKELEDRVSRVRHAIGRVLCEDPKAMAGWLREPSE